MVATALTGRRSPLFAARRSESQHRALAQRSQEVAAANQEIWSVQAQLVATERIAAIAEVVAASTSPEALQLRNRPTLLLEMIVRSIGPRFAGFILAFRRVPL